MGITKVARALLLATAVACGGGSSEPTTQTPSALDIISGNGQTGLVGLAAATPLVVRVSANGSAISGATVNFAVTTGTATVSPTTTTTDAAGQAKTQVTFGATAGTVSITASVAGTSLSATFLLTAGNSSNPPACQTGSSTTPAAGGVLPGIAGTGICLSGGPTGAEYAIVAFNGNPDSSSSTSVNVTGSGATGVTSASVAPTGPVIAASLLQGRPNTLQAAFDAQLRENARRELTPLMPAARAALRQRASYSAIPANPTVGSVLTLNANGVQSCTNAKNVGARVVAVSNTAIVVADTLNPSGGFATSDYQSFATMFDTLINPLDVANFGQPTDIDNNGKVVIFFTKEVNALTPRTGGFGVVYGFFFERDLFPLADNPTLGLKGCPGSNFAEMFYVLVPDPQGVYSGARTTSDVLKNTPGTLAHEYQHLINAGRRLYVNNATAFEDVWLNEGLSHIAEELLFYKVSGTAPRQNIASSNFTGNTALTNAFNTYEIDNINRFDTFLNQPATSSPYAENDSLQTRGATWNLLRYLADHRGPADADTWSLLVNTPLTGQANLRNVFGSTYLTQIRDWATSVFADDIPGVTDPRFLEPGWNMRSIFPRLQNSSGQSLGTYPLRVVPLSTSSPASLSIQAGGAAYLRFSVPANSQASIDWTSAGLPVSPYVQFTVVRSR